MAEPASNGWRDTYAILARVSNRQLTAAGRLIIVSGLPGAGKTTLARQLERDLGAVRFCPDEWMADFKIDLFDRGARERIEQLQWRLAQRLLELGTIVVIEWGTWGRAERDALRERARDIGAAVELHFLDAPVRVLWARVQDRDIERELGHRPLTHADLEDCAAIIQRPDAEEFALFDPPLVTGASAPPDAPPATPTAAVASIILRLQPLRVTDEMSARATHDELAADGFSFLLGWHPADDWLAYLERLRQLRRGRELPPDRVPATFLVAVVGSDIVGRVSIRHELTPFLADVGGHIGYGVRPGYRRRGYAGEILRQALVIARAEGVDQVLVTCDDDNIASSQAIERHGGVLEDVRVAQNGVRKRRYWIA